MLRYIHRGTIVLVLISTYLVAETCPRAPVMGTNMSKISPYYQYGDDTYYRYGIISVGQIVDNGDGTLTDTLSELMWTKDADMFKEAGQTSGIVGEANITQALQTCLYATTANYDDWRLPNIRELQSLINYGKIGNMFRDVTLFQNTGQYGYYYWTSTPKYYDNDDNYGNDYWYVDFVQGTTNYDRKTEEHHVICVRNHTSDCKPAAPVTIIW